ncbi:helix-turn-helix transcriptional regulator [Lactiplantibacillus sp. DA1]|uniref:helix-turn-helix domain-containing protein n=1 Tax=Lactiplantibacillus sp. DA1 TaxID=3079857 RepID=UPI00292A61B6|nr:helix-turn-helix transcriptional regulator [Lactiplantibacillus sp. DA1]MDV0429504.1 helix-turn-helix transcriptional regulator [Lactiplantibacillus sp. DA1]
MTKGQRIAKMRKRKDESQNVLSKVLHVSPSTIGMWETDQRAIKDEDLSKLADHFGVTTDYILGRKVDLGNVPVAAHIDGDFEDLTDEERQEINDYIEFKKAQFKKRKENENKD